MDHKGPVCGMAIEESKAASTAHPPKHDLLFQQRELQGEIPAGSGPIRRQRTRRPLLMVVPLFVFFNAGLRLTDVRGDVLVTPVGLGLVLALVVGKPVGIVGAAWAAARLGLAQRPQSLSWPQVVGVGMLGGIGFTVSLFLASLAFTGSALAGAAKLGILAGSSVSAVLGLTVLRLASRHAPEPGLGRP